jgi:hypothetical protein
MISKPKALRFQFSTSSCRMPQCMDMYLTYLQSSNKFIFILKSLPLFLIWIHRLIQKRRQSEEQKKINKFYFSENVLKISKKNLFRRDLHIPFYSNRLSKCFNDLWYSQKHYRLTTKNVSKGAMKKTFFWWGFCHRNNLQKSYIIILFFFRCLKRCEKQYQ